MARKESVLGSPGTEAAPWEDGAPAAGDVTPKGGTVAPRPLTGEIVAATPAIQTVIDWMMEHLTMRAEDSLSGLESVIRDILEAPDMATVLRETLPVSSQNFVDIPIDVHGFELHESDSIEDDSAPAYASLRVEVVETGERRVINGGGWAMLAQLMKADLAGQWPLRVKIKEGRAKGNRNPPLRLVAVD